MTTENNLKQNTLYSRDIIDFQFFSDFKILLSWCWFFYLLNTLHLIWAFSCCMVGCVVSSLLYPDLFLLWYNPLQLGFELLVRPLQEVDLLTVLLLLALNIFLSNSVQPICSSLLSIKRELSFPKRKNALWEPGNQAEHCVTLVRDFLLSLFHVCHVSQGPPLPSSKRIWWHVHHQLLNPVSTPLLFSSIIFCFPLNLQFPFVTCFCSCALFSTIWQVIFRSDTSFSKPPWVQNCAHCSLSKITLTFSSSSLAI